MKKIRTAMISSFSNSHMQNHHQNHKNKTIALTIIKSCTVPFPSVDKIRIGIKYVTGTISVTYIFVRRMIFQCVYVNADSRHFHEFIQYSC